MKMLLKQSNPEHATNTGSMSPRSLSTTEHTHNTIPHIDPLDDVFGSAESPVFEEDGDHYFGDGDGDDDDNELQPRDLLGRHHPSDMRRLRQEHTTAGYRDGIAVAKASSIQAGFDEGFALGGTIGLKVGRVLGLLEGIVGALGGEPVAAAAVTAAAPQASSSSSSAAEFKAASKLLSDARAELDLRSVFSPKFWNEDGTWKYQVGDKEGDKESEGEGDGDVLFSHVAEAHPLVQKWSAAVEGLMSKWGLQEQLPLLQRPEDEDSSTALEPAAKAKTSTQSQSEAKAPSDALSW